MDAKKYTKVEDDVLLHWAAINHGETQSFQQHNATIHTARIVSKFFQQRGVDLLPSSAQSSDVNAIKNLWAIVLRTIYANAVQFNNLTELKSAISDAWSSIDGHTLQMLSNSMSCRCKAVITSHGDFS